MKRILFTLLILFATVSIANAQVMTDVIIKLKSGIELRGDIMEEVPGESITVRTPEGDLFYYSFDEVASIKDPNSASKKRAEEQRLKQEKINARLQAKEDRRNKREELSLGNYVGYKGILDFSGGFLSDDYYTYLGYFGASFINGVNLGAHFSIGIGVGIDYRSRRYYYDDDAYDYYGYTDLNVPVFLNLRIPFAKNRRVSPYLAANVGYSFNVWSGYELKENNVCGGHSYIYFEPSFGLDFRIKRHSSFFIAISTPLNFCHVDNKLQQFAVGAKMGFTF